MFFRVVSMFLLFLSQMSAYGAVNITIGEGNEIKLPDEYAAPGWSATWYLEDGTEIPSALLRVGGPTSVTILSNVGYVFAVLKEAETGKTTRTSGVNADRLRSRVAKVTLDGSGSATSISVINNGVTGLPDFSVEIAGIVAEAPMGKAVVVLPPLSGLVGEYDINVNFPERVGAMLLDNMGITAIEVDGACRNLLELSLDGNALTFAGLPEELPAKCVVNYGEQAPVHISTLQDGITVALSDQNIADLTVEWFDENDEPIGEDCYEKDGQVYVFDNYTGKAWCRMTSESKGLSLRSSVVNISVDLRPVFSASWAGASGNAAFSITMTEKGSIVIDDGNAVRVDAGEETWFRIPGASGTMTVSASSPEAVDRIDLQGIGLYEFEVQQTATGVTSLAVGDNALTPGSLPSWLPAGCEVDWGAQARLDISRLCNRQERWIDLTEMNDVEVTWHDSRTGEPINEEWIRERPKGLFTFSEDAGSVWGEVRSTKYDGLVWETSEVAFPIVDGLVLVTGDAPQEMCRVAEGRIVSQCKERLRVYTIDGRLKCEIAPMGERSMPRGLYIVSGPGKAVLVRI